MGGCSVEGTRSRLWAGGKLYGRRRPKGKRLNIVYFLKTLAIVILSGCDTVRLAAVAINKEEYGEGDDDEQSSTSDGAAYNGANVVGL